MKGKIRKYFLKERKNVAPCFVRQLNMTHYMQSHAGFFDFRKLGGLTVSGYLPEKYSLSVVYRKNVSHALTDIFQFLPTFYPFFHLSGDYCGKKTAV